MSKKRFRNGTTPRVEMVTINPEKAAKWLE